MCDNQSAIQLIKHPHQRQKTKHIAVRYHFIRSQEKERAIKMEYITSENQLAATFTKALPEPRFSRLRAELGVLPVPE
jgi:hypothetical protein